MSQQPFEVVVAEHGDAVWRMCRAMLDPVSAQDAWSETFLAAMRAYPRLRPGSNVQAWLVTIAHRKAIDQARAASRRPVPTDELPEPAGRAGGEGVPATVPGEDLPDDSPLLDAVRALPDKQRLAVAYHHLAGLSHAEVAEIVGGTAAASRRAAADGIAALRRAFPRPPSSSPSGPSGPSGPPSGPPTPTRPSTPPSRSPFTPPSTPPGASPSPAPSRERPARTSTVRTPGEGEAR